MPQALAHDYRLEGPAAVTWPSATAPTRERLPELGDRLVREEVERGARLRAARRGELSG